jgi:hypothetical protein
LRIAPDSSSQVARRKQLGIGRDHVLVAVAGRTTQRDDVVRVGICDRLEFGALAAALGTQGQPRRAAGQVHRRTRRLNVDRVQLGVGRCADRRRDGVAKRLAVGPGILADAPTAHNAVGLAAFDVDEEAETVLGEVPGAERQRGLACIAVPVAENAVRRIGHRAGEVLAQDDVDHAGDGIEP